VQSDVAARQVGALVGRFQQFRAVVYDCFGARRDALFELLDAATVAGLVPSLAYLSLPPVHRRRWGSLYDALAAGTLEAPSLRELIARYPLDDGQPIYALDTSVWPRDDAETSPGRGHYYSSARQSAGKPIVTGWSFSWLAQLNFTHDSWTAPLDVQRVPAGGNVHAVYAVGLEPSTDCLTRICRLGQHNWADLVAFRGQAEQVSVCKVADWDPLAPETLADPLGTHAELRRTCPVAWSDQFGGFWALFKYDDVVAAARDSETFISSVQVNIPSLQSEQRIPLQSDPPEHTFFRKLLQTYFHYERLRAMEPKIRGVVVELLEPLLADSQGDAYAQLTYPCLAACCATSFGCLSRITP
jgi:hypothetical protein